MAIIAPPPRHFLVAMNDGGGVSRTQLRLMQWSWALATVLITAWCISLGPIPGIIAVVTAKHVLVAILVIGLGVDNDLPPRPWRQPTARRTGLSADDPAAPEFPSYL